MAAQDLLFLEPWILRIQHGRHEPRRGPDEKLTSIGGERCDAGNCDHIFAGGGGSGTLLS